MKTVMIDGEKRVTLVEVPTPHAFGHFAVVRIHSAPMCTEYRGYIKGVTACHLGHEAAGEVVEMAHPGRVKPGDRVIVMPQFPCGHCSLCLSGEYIHCQHLVDPLVVSDERYGTATYAEYLLKPAWLLIPIPDDLSYDEGAMACCGLGPALGASSNMNIQQVDTVLITGLGPVGLGGVIACTSRGARVIGVTRNNYRKDLALQLGADAVIDPMAGNLIDQVMALTNGRGVDKAIECSGEISYQSLALKAVARKGQIAFIGESDQLTIDVSNDLLRKGLTLHGIWHWNLNHTDEMLELIRSSKEKIQRLITHVFPLERVEEAFQLQSTGQCGKVVLRP